MIERRPTEQNIGDDMKNGVCPKCAAREVYQAAGSRFGNEMLNLTDGLINKGLAPDKYVCGQCGYLEYYLPTEDSAFQIIRDKWDRVAAA